MAKQKSEKTTPEEKLLKIRAKKAAYKNYEKQVIDKSDKLARVKEKLQEFVKKAEERIEELNAEIKSEQIAYNNLYAEALALKSDFENEIEE
jgi:menaquinone-dependent protoporphyrinogen IX oxidase